MSTVRKQRVVIAGGGTAGWMAAAAIGKAVGKVSDITLVESDAIGTVGVGEATIPPLLNFNRLCGIEEPEFMKAVRGTFKLGIAFENWTDVGHRYIHSFGITGKDHWTAGFQHFWRRGKEMGIADEFGNYCLELVAAEEEKFAHLPDLGLNYAYHIDSSAYAALLRKHAESHGVVRKEGKIQSIERDGESGELRSITLEDGTVLEGDLFIDCTGFRALLIGGALGAGYHDWTHWLPCDRAIAVQTKSIREPLPYTRSIAHEAGWRWQIPLQHRTGNGTVFCSRFMSEDEARAKLLEDVEGETLTEPRVIHFRTGMRREHWKKNCVALGLASGFIEPLESTSIHLIQRSIIRLLQMWPHGRVSDEDIAEFNAQTDYEVEHIRDFIILHYNLTNRTDTEFWRHVRSMDIPENLKHRMDLFRETGRVFKANDQLFAENSWVQVMLGQGIMPETYHPTADVMDEQEITRFLDHVKTNVSRTVAGLPRHKAYIESYCPADV
ncbi:tryptophan halogenase family protein [Parvularcula lutaonensis]|uniref:Tryptophan halogenase family protein n=1 Tax=Parvularcula lutaonensis TaxID=491923 RepID=A0ABV7MAM4_9PROT|nr:tryptophan halogenase family protein [Parvularcula lutaonensis]GGY37919.1 tryptophan halogenase [Parvularcula lutaonensis]